MGKPRLGQQRAPAHMRRLGSTRQCHVDHRRSQARYSAAAAIVKESVEIVP